MANFKRAISRILGATLLLLAPPAAPAFAQHVVVGPLQAQNKLSEILAGGSAYQSAAQNNLGITALLSGYAPLANPTFTGTVNGTALNFVGPVSTQIGSSITQSGAVCNGSNDDTAAINTYLATFTSGGLVYVPPGKQCLINSANLTIPANVRLVGAAGPVTNAYAPAGVSAILLNPTYTIILNAGAQLDHLLIQRSALLANPTAAQVISAVTTWGAERSVGVTLPANLGGQRLNDLFIIGFNTAIKASAGQFSMQDIAGDDYNGVEVQTAGDNATIDDVRFEPYYAFNTSATSGSWARPGIAFNFHDGDTLGPPALTRGFSFMYANAIVMNNIGITQVDSSGFEWQNAYGNGLTGAQGVRFISSCPGCSINNTTFNGFDTPVSVESASGINLTNLRIAGETVTDFYLAGGAATATTITVGGTPIAGNTISATLTSSSISGSPVTIAHTAVAGDTASTVASGLMLAIDANQALIAARVSATVSGSVVTIQWPASASVTVGVATTGGITDTTGTTSGLPGSSGQIAAPQIVHTTTGAPSFVVGNTSSSANAWLISSPSLTNGTGPLPSNWLVWNDPNGGSTQEITLSGIQWSSWISTGPLSSCGTSPAVGPGFTYDSHGTITEGSSATGCTVTFVTPYPWTPQVSITNWAGNASQVALSAISATGFTVTNASASGNKFTFTVTP